MNEHSQHHKLSEEPRTSGRQLFLIRHAAETLPGFRAAHQKESRGRSLYPELLKHLLEKDLPNQGASVDAWIQVSLRGQQESS